MAAEATDFDDEFLSGSSMLPRNSKGGRGRAPGGIYGWPWHALGVRFWRGGAMDGGQWRRAHPGLCPSLTVVLTGGAHPSVEGKRDADTLSGKRGSGLGLAFGTGPNGSPTAFYSFSVFFSLFYFSDF
jgi:hypothetical protein